jgi:hypothetical protein
MVSVGLVALSVAVYANKQIYTAKLTKCPGKSATGSAAIRTKICGTGLEYQVAIRGLQTAAKSVRLLAPNSTTVVAYLCHDSLPSMFGTCPAPDTSLFASFEGSLNPQNFLVSPPVFFNYLEDEQVYIDVTLDDQNCEGSGKFVRIFNAPNPPPCNP